MTTLTDSERVDVRRFCGYPAYGTGPSGMQSWRYFQIYGLFEFRINNLALTEDAIVRRYLATLTALELAVPAASDNLDTDQAATWGRNKTEIDDRVHLLDNWRRRLCGFIGIPPGPALSTGAPMLVI